MTTTPTIPTEQALAFKIRDAETRMRFCATDSAALSWARQLVDARFTRGDYPMLQTMTADVREAMARALVKEMRGEK
jgi:hypothetical protein